VGRFKLARHAVPAAARPAAAAVPPGLARRPAQTAALPPRRPKAVARAGRGDEDEWKEF